MMVRGRQWGVTCVALLVICTLIELLIAGLFGVGGVRAVLVRRAEIQIQVAADTPDSRIQQLYAGLRSLSFVGGVTYVPKEQVLERERRTHPDLVAFTEKANLRNPFPSVFSIALTSLRHDRDLEAFLSQPQWKDVVQPTYLSAMRDQEGQMGGALQTTDTVSTFLWALLGCAIVILSVVMVALVRRRAEQCQADMELERLLGASDIDVLTPFATELVISLLVALLAGTALVVGAAMLLPFLGADLPSSLSDAVSAAWSSVRLAGVPVVLLELVLALPLAVGAVFLGVRVRSL